MTHPPKTHQQPHQHQLHGDVRIDEYYWLREKDNSEVIEHLQAENAYCDSLTAPLIPLKESIFEDMASRIPATESPAPAQSGPYFYGWRIDLDNQYPVYYRKRAASRSELDTAPEEMLLDVNQLAPQDGGYIDVSVVKISPDHQRLAYLENRDGSDRYRLYVKDLASGDLVEEPIDNVFIDDSVAFALSGEALYYVAIDEAQRPYRLYRHTIGSTDDVLLFEESDITREIAVTTSQSGEYLFMNSSTKTSAEVWYLPLREDDAQLRLFANRQPDVLYSLEHWQDQFLILTNDQAENFRLAVVPTDTPNPADARDLFPYQPDRYLERVHPFNQGLVVEGRQDGLTQIWTYRQGQLTRLSWDEPLYTVSVAQNLGAGPDEVLLEYESMLTPRTDVALTLETAQTHTLGHDAVRRYHSSAYQQMQLWVSARDGVKVPVSLVGRREAFAGRPSPTILLGYGSYGMSINPTFDPERLALLDRGIIFALAHVRGGSEMGHGWYQDGKLRHKMNTFTDFIDTAQHLVDEGYTEPARLAAIGRSAGGLLMGAILNMRPDLFRAVVAGVPFVDVVTTMLDASIPLTALEWDEWGNPANPDDYAYMMQYSPYDNVKAQDYPHLYVYTGLNDPRVGYFEPAKWVARLRDRQTGQKPVLLKTHMGSGHFGSSGRLGHLQDLAMQYAFLLHWLGVDSPENR